MWEPEALVILRACSGRILQIAQSAARANFDDGDLFVPSNVSREQVTHGWPLELVAEIDTVISNWGGRVRVEGGGWQCLKIVSKRFEAQGCSVRPEPLSCV